MAASSPLQIGGSLIGLSSLSGVRAKSGEFLAFRLDVHYNILPFEIILEWPSVLCALCTVEDADMPAPDFAGGGPGVRGQH